MAERTSHERAHHLPEVGLLMMAAFAVPLFVWSAFNGDYFDLAHESFIIPLAVFFGGPVGIIAAVLAYHRRDMYVMTMSGVIGAFWLTYGMLLWLIRQDVIDGATAGGDMRGLLFAAWAATFGILWVGSMRAHWTLSLLSLGTAAMFVLLSIGYYRDSPDALQVGGWIGFVTAGLAWYAALAETLNAEFEEPVLPTDLGYFRRFHLRA